MKHLNFLLAALAAVTLSSCAEELKPDDINVRGDVTQISASFAESDTKTVLAENGTSILWSPNDEISVFYNGDGVKFTSINNTPKDRAIFMSQYSLIYGGTETSGEPYLYGICPYSSDNAQNGDSLTLTVPSVQTAVDGSFAHGSFPSVGRSKTTEMAFYNVCGGICFTVSQNGIRKMVFNGNDDEVLAGKVKVVFDNEGHPRVAAVMSGEKSITLSAPDTNGFQVGRKYYLSMLPTALTKGFNVEFIKRADESERGTRTISSSLEVKRSVFGSVENLDSGVSFKVGLLSLSIFPVNVLVEQMTAVQLSLTILPSDAADEIKWSSSDKTIASVDEDGMVVGKKEGKCTVTATSGNGKTANCTVYVSKTLVTTNSVTEIYYSAATLNGTFNVADAQSVSKTGFFLYSDAETTLDGLKSNGTRVGTTLSDSTFAYNLKSLNPGTKYCYVAGVSFSERDYYGEVKDFTTSPLPEESVDLGLSVKWRSWNVGASRPEEEGTYFGWGDVDGQTRKVAYNGYNYWSHGGFSHSYDYELDANGNLKPEYDAAHVNLGGSWRMPTKAEFQELIDNCTSTWTDNYNGTGVSGCIFASNKTGNTDESVFLPYVPYGRGNICYDGCSSVWSSTFYKNEYAWYLNFTSDGVCTAYYNRLRSYGQPVRPVTE